MCIYSTAHIQHLKRSGRKSVSIWGCFSAEGAGALYRHEGTNTAIQYRAVLNDVLMPFTEFRFENCPAKFVHDNSRLQKANSVRACLHEHLQLNVHPWSGRGGDMNPIENVWGNGPSASRTNLPKRRRVMGRNKSNMGQFGSK